MSHPVIKAIIALKLVIFAVCSSTDNERKEDNCGLLFFFPWVRHWKMIMLERCCILACPLSGVVIRVCCVCISEPGALCSAVWLIARKRSSLPSLMPLMTDVKQPGLTLCKSPSMCLQ